MAFNGPYRFRPPTAPRPLGSFETSAAGDAQPHPFLAPRPPAPLLSHHDDKMRSSDFHRRNGQFQPVSRAFRPPSRPSPPDALNRSDPHQPAARKSLFHSPKSDDHEVDEENESFDDLTDFINERIDQEIDDSLAATQDPSITLPLMTPGGTDSGSTAKLKPVTDLPERYRAIFAQFRHFNLIQSACYDDVVHSERSVVVSAPTGSGKTVIFELAIVRALQHTTKPKMVYVSPMKSLCSERFRDWKEKFEPLGVRILELTGDSSNEDAALIRNYNLVLTTPEKWDVVTRRWRDHRAMIESVSLLMIDEVHLLNDTSRGHTLEAIVSRMKTVQKAVKTNEFRYIAVSATIPNAEDIATWLDGVCHKFGEEKRPVKLRKIVFGYPHRPGTSDFKFELNLTYKLADLVATYSDGKPTLIFANARQSTQFTANTIAREANFKPDWAHRQRLEETAASISNQKLAECIVNGVGFHHAGLEAGDRRTVEELFLGGDLMVLVSTSTLAMGVNLPAHLVIIKGTGQLIAGSYKEYSESQILQMIGRAGRPQFDTSATAIILTREANKTTYANLVNGTQLVESSLHESMLEHLNAEIALQTITDIAYAIEWLKSTFFFVRVLKNPSHYKFHDVGDPEKLERLLQDLCVRNLNALAQIKLITMSETQEVSSSKSGALMARYYVAFETMKTFAEIKGDEELSQMIALLCKSKEFDEFQLRRSEKSTLNALNSDKKKANVRFPLKDKIKDKTMKTNVLLQATLGCLSINDFAMEREAQRILQLGQRVSKCLVEYLWGENDAAFAALKNAVILAKCVSCGLWNNSEHVSKQIDRVGLAYSTRLVHAEMTNFAKIANSDPRDLEVILNKQAPFGNHVRNAALHMPQYAMVVEQIGQRNPSRATIKVSVSLVNASALQDRNQAGNFHTCVLLVGNTCNNHVVLKAKVRDTALLAASDKKYERTVSVTYAKSVKICWISERFAGLDIIQTISPIFKGGEQSEVVGVTAPPTPRPMLEPAPKRKKQEKPKAKDVFDVDIPGKDAEKSKGLMPLPKPGKKSILESADELLDYEFKNLVEDEPDQGDVSLEIPKGTPRLKQTTISFKHVKPRNNKSPTNDKTLEGRLPEKEVVKPKSFYDESEKNQQCDMNATERSNYSNAKKPETIQANTKKPFEAIHKKQENNLSKTFMGKHQPSKTAFGSVQQQPNRSSVGTSFSMSHEAREQPSRNLSITSKPTSTFGRDFGQKESIPSETNQGSLSPSVMKDFEAEWQLTPYHKSDERVAPPKTKFHATNQETRNSANGRMTLTKKLTYQMSCEIEVKKDNPLPTPLKKSQKSHYFQTNFGNVSRQNYVQESDYRPRKIVTKRPFYATQEPKSTFHNETRRTKRNIEQNQEYSNANQSTNFSQSQFNYSRSEHARPRSFASDTSSPSPRYSRNAHVDSPYNLSQQVKMASPTSNSPVPVYEERRVPDQEFWSPPEQQFNSDRLFNPRQNEFGREYHQEDCQPVYVEEDRFEQAYDDQQIGSQALRNFYQKNFVQRSPLESFDYSFSQNENLKRNPGFGNATLSSQPLDLSTFYSSRKYNNSSFRTGYY